MHPNSYLSPLAVVVLTLGLTPSLQAAEPLPLTETTFTQLKQKFQLGLPGAMQGMVAGKNSLQFIKQHTDNKKVTHIRMQQHYLGFPVFGGYAIIHSKNTPNALTAARGAVLMDGLVYEGLQADLGAPKPSFAANSANALAHFKSQYNVEQLSEEEATPLVYIDENKKAHWAYKVSFLVQHETQIPERPTAIVDAETLVPFIQWNDIKTIKEKVKVQVKGVGFGGNKKMGEYRYGETLPMLEITRNTKTNFCYMENKEVKVVDMKHKYSAPNTAMKFACKPSESLNAEDSFYTGYKADGYDKDNGAASPTNDALHAGFVIKKMYKDWYNVEALKKADGKPMKLIMRVHYGEGYENAYWDGKQMTFGDGDSMMYPLVSLGISGHEVSHGFTEQHSGLEYFGQSGGMNESFSDMAAQAVEYYSSGKNSWQIAPEVMKEGSGYEALRYMDKPSKDGTSIDTADEYKGGINVHYSSGVFNHLFYILATQPEWNTRKAFDVMVKANMDYWTPYSTFNEGGCGVLKAAKDLSYSLDDVKKALTEVAIKYETCFKE